MPNLLDDDATHLSGKDRLPAEFGDVGRHSIERAHGTTLDQIIDAAIYRRISRAILQTGRVNYELSVQGWSHDLTFSADDQNTVSWTSGTIETQDGSTFSINSGNTGNMSSQTYIYLDVEASTTDLQTTTNRTDAVGYNRIMVAMAKNVSESSKDASYRTFGGGGDAGMNDLWGIDSLAANSVDTNELVANAVTATEINVATLSAISADVGTLTAGTIRDSNSKYVEDLDNALLTIKDDQATPVTRVQIGKFGTGSSYGIKVWDSSGSAILDLTGLGSDTVDTAQLVADAVTATEIKASTITGTEITGSTLSAIYVDAGTITAGTLRDSNSKFVSDLSNALLTITDDQATPVDRVKVGKFGSGSNFGLKVWDSSGTLVANLTGSDTNISGWTIASNTLTSGNVTIDSDAEQFLLGAATDPTTGKGIFLGKVSGTSTYDFRAGDPSASGESIHWDESAGTLTHSGSSFTANSPTFTGTVNVEAGEGVTTTQIGTSGSGGQVNLSNTSGSLRGQVLVDSSDRFALVSPSGTEFRINVEGAKDFFFEDGSPDGTTGQTILYNDASFSVGWDSGNDELWIYDETNSHAEIRVPRDGTIRFPQIATTSNSANAVLISAQSEELRRSTSTLNAKEVIGNIGVGEARDIVMGLRPFWFRSKLERDDPDKVHAGFGAEEVAEVNDSLVTRDEDGDPDWVQYPRLTAPMLRLVQNQQKRIDELEARLDELTA